MLTIAHKSCTSQNSFNLEFVVVLPSYRLHFCIIPKNLAWSQNYKCKKVLITLILSIAIIDMHLDIQAMTLQDNRVNINSCSIQLRKKIICHFIYWNIIAASLFITILVDNHANNRISLRQYRVRSYKYGQRVFSNLQMAWKKDTYLAHKYSLHIWNATIFFSLLAPYNRFAMSVSNWEHHMRLIWYMSSVIHVSFTRLKIQT